MARCLSARRVIRRLPRGWRTGSCGQVWMDQNSGHRTGVAPGLEALASPGGAVAGASCGVAAAATVGVALAGRGDGSATTGASVGVGVATAVAAAGVGVAGTPASVP